MVDHQTLFHIDIDESSLMMSSHLLICMFYKQNRKNGPLILSQMRIYVHSYSFISHDRFSNANLQSY
jgi:hypothetical protein